MKFSKVVLAGIFLSVAAYIVTVFYFSWHEKTVPSELTIAFFSFISVEVWSLAVIKKKEIEKEGGE